jgi:two-component system cell cycle response regulator
LDARPGRRVNPAGTARPIYFPHSGKNRRSDDILVERSGRRDVRFIVERSDALTSSSHTVGPGTIVVIDDDDRMLDLIGTVLTGAGYRVLPASDPRKGVDLVRHEKPLMVICDILMPGMDGHAVHKALSADPETSNVAFLFLSGQGAFTQRVKAFGETGADFMAKPFTPAILLRKVERLLAKHRPGGGAGDSDGAPAARASSLSSDARLSGSELASLPIEMRRVLLVDDCREYRDFVRELLESNGFTVIEAGSADEALRKGIEERPWLALMDVNLPAVDGFELCRRFRSQAVLRHVPVIFLSARDDFADRRKGYDAGGDEYLPKTTRPRELLLRICLMLGRLTESVGWTRRSVGMQGDIEVIGPAGVLQMFHLGRLSGACQLRQGEQQIEIRFRDGEVVGARAGQKMGADAVFSFLSWTSGRFEFEPGDPGPAQPLEQTFGELLLEGCRRLDESRRH